jgi:hypothetical protein
MADNSELLDYLGSQWSRMLMRMQAAQERLHAASRSPQAREAQQYMDPELGPAMQEHGQQLYAQTPEGIAEGFAGPAAVKGVGGKLSELLKGPASELLGQFPSTSLGRILGKTKGGGYSVNLATGDVPTSGLMVGKYQNTDPRNLVISGTPTRADILAMVNKNQKAYQSPDTYLGSWLNPDDAKTYLDVVRRFDPGEKNATRLATKYGERSGQLGLYDIGAGQTLPVGNWNEFIRSPEFGQRLTQMAQEGRGYLNQFPAKEWWDMHGGPFERVYGQERLPQVAGYTASTAPNSAPRENLQTMSEYMRRFIKGEPAVQPEWRVPPGEMTRQEGKKIGMETSRAANLRKSESALLSQLREDKVREEAQALMGDPNAVVLDRHWARLAENPAAGVYTAGKPGLVEPGKQYQALKDQISIAAQAANRSPRDYSADVWTGIREHIKANSDLFGQKFKGSAITGESKSYADHFEDLIRDKAKHLGISQEEMERRLSKGDATLMSALLASPLIYSVYQQVSGASGASAPAQ